MKSRKKLQNRNELQERKKELESKLDYYTLNSPHAKQNNQALVKMAEFESQLMVLEEQRQRHKGTGRQIQDEQEIFSLKSKMKKFFIEGCGREAKQCILKSDELMKIEKALISLDNRGQKEKLFKERLDVLSLSQENKSKIIGLFKSSLDSTKNTEETESKRNGPR